MKIQNALGVSIIVFAVALAVCFSVKMLASKSPLEEVAESELWYVGEGGGQHWYLIAKEEIKDWLDIVKPLLPTVGILLGLWVKKRRKINE